MKWLESSLSLEEIEHLKQTAGVSDFKSLMGNATGQKELRSWPGASEPCFKCKEINKKLGLPV